MCISGIAFQIWKTVSFYKEVLGLVQTSRTRSPRGSETAFLKAPDSDVQIEICEFNPFSNLGVLLYGIGNSTYPSVQLKSRAEKFKLKLPLVHSIVMNRSTQYDKKASKAFNAMFEAIQRKAKELKDKAAENFVGGQIIFFDIPDSHSVAIVCSHSGMPLLS